MTRRRKRSNGKPANRDSKKRPASRRRLHLEELESRNLLTTYLVDNILDESDGNFSVGDLSLREAVEQSNLSAGADTITFDSALSGGTVTLTMGELSITDDLTITGLGADNLAVSGNNASRVFNIDDGEASEFKTVTFDGITVTGGWFDIGGGGISDGGGIFNDENLSIRNTAIVSNFALADGGGLYNDSGVVSVIGSSFSGNVGLGFGGAIFNRLGAVTILDSRISQNSAASSGGGLRNASSLGVMTVESSSIFDNVADFSGGGIYNHGNTTVVNSAVYGNSADNGGGVRNSGTLFIQNSTVSSNAGGIVNVSGTLNLEQSTVSFNTLAGLSVGNFGTATLSNSIIAHNKLGDLFVSNGGILVTAGANIVEKGDVTWPGVLNVDPLLRPLEDNGGPTLTHALYGGSPALDAGDDTVVSDAGLTTDQRGFARVVGAHVDIGAYESSDIFVDTIIDEDDGDLSKGDVSLREAIALANTRSGADVITFAASLDGATIQLQLGQIAITDDVTIAGAGIAVNVSGNFSNRVFNVDDGAAGTARTVVIDGLTVSNGRAIDGGGIRNTENLIVRNTTLRENVASSGGGALFNAGGQVTVLNSTISHNSANVGGGLKNAIGSLNLQNSTVAGNNAESGGGLFNDSAGELTLANSIVAGNGGGDVANNSGLLDAAGFNIVQDGSVLEFGVFNVDPLLGPLRNNGGPTQTHALLPGSPARDVGDNSVAVAMGLAFDQRGTSFARVFGSNVDLGAFEADYIVVDTLQDEDDGDYSSGQFSLREAVRLTNENPGAEAITFSNELAHETIVLTLGQLEISDDLTITGLGVNAVTIDGNNSSRVMYIDDNSSTSSISVVIDSLTIANGRVSGSTEKGGGILTNEELILRHSTLTGNTAGDHGGGLYSTQETVEVTSSTISGNSANAGGGLGNGVGNLIVRNSTIFGNSADLGGAAVFHGSYSLVVVNTTMTGNQSNSGSALSIASTLATATLQNTTIVENDSQGVSYGSGSLTLINSIVADNSGDDIRSSLGTLTTHGVNIIADASVTGPGILNVDPLLGPLQDNGGPTVTHALLPDSPARDAGDNAFSEGVYVDQRGKPRVSFENVDLGAFEANDFVVDNAVDELDFDFSSGDLSLREAVWLSNNTPGENIVSFSNSLIGQSIILTMGQLQVTDDLAITDVIDVGVTVDGNQLGRVFDIDDGDSLHQIQVSIEGLRITGGAADDGAGIRNREDLILCDSTIDYNTATSSGGGIFNSGLLEITNSTVTENAGDLGAGVDNSGGTATISHSTVSNNYATNQGGGVANDTGSLQINASTFVGNAAFEGGGLHILTGDVAIHNSTFSGNTAGLEGGGISNAFGQVVVLNSTFSGNAGTFVGGIDNQTGFLAIANTIVTGSIGSDVSFVDPHGVNVVSDGSLTGTGVFNIDPLLGPLADNGGPTLTHALLPGSPARDIGDDGVAAGLLTDQRGEPFARLFGDHVDVGAFESNFVVIDTLVDESDGDVSEGDLSLREAIEIANAAPGEATIAFHGDLWGQTIVLTMGHLSITDDLTISGPGAARLTVSGNRSSRVFKVDDGDGDVDRNVVIEGLTISDGYAVGEDDDGGGVFNDESLIIRNSTIVGNYGGDAPSGQGGGIFNSRSLVVENSMIVGNSANAGGAIYTQNLDSTTTIHSSTLYGNEAPFAGAIRNSGGVVNVVNSTISGNRGDVNPAIESSEGSMHIVQSTIVGNSSTSGSFRVLDGVMTLSNSIVAYNGNGFISSLVNFEGVNIVDIGAVTGEGILNVDPLLGPLNDNGGPTLTHALLPGSPARDAGDNSFVLDAGLQTDQRGGAYARIEGGEVDLGAYEANYVVVDTLLDESDGNYSIGDFSLREAIELANASPGPDAIGFHQSLSGGVIVLTLGHLDVTDHLNIIDVAGAGVTISGNGLGRVFNVDDGIDLKRRTVVFEGLTISNGNSTDGGGIYNAENLELRKVAVSRNVAALDGGGVFNSGSLTTRGSTISDNSASDGGGIYNQAGEVKLFNSTVSGNSAFDGAGIHNSEGAVFALNSTIAGNDGLIGGGFSNVLGQLSLANSIVAGNLGSDVDDVLGSVTFAGMNIVQDGSVTDSNVLNVDPLLGPLVNNGGVTQTHAVPLNSPARDAGENKQTAAAGLANDQRGLNFLRIAGSRVDIGAVESNFLIVDTLTDENDSDTSAGDFSLREAVDLSNRSMEIETVTFDPSLANQSIVLTLGELDVTKSMRILGLGADSLTIDGNNTDRVFNVDDGLEAASTVFIENLTITGASGAIWGGAIYNDEVLTIRQVNLFGNEVGVWGGAVYNEAGILTIENSAIHDNYAGSWGGGLRNADGVVLIRNSTVSGNSSDTLGGGISSSGGTLTVINSTVTGNRSDFDAGISAGDAGVVVVIANSIFADNSEYDVFVVGTLIVKGVNIIADGNVTGPGIINADPMLLPLTDNGGPTPTHGLLHGSPAIDAGDDGVARDAGLITDQRGVGFERFIGQSDIGAYEFFGPPTISEQVLSVDENETVVGFVDAGDRNLNRDTLTYSLTGNGADASLFTIDAAGELRFIDAPDFEAPADMGGVIGDNLYEVEVKVVNVFGFSDTAVVTVSVAPVDEFPITLTSETSSSVLEGTTFVQTLTATDEDLPDVPITFSISSNDFADNALFQVIDNRLEFINPPDYLNPMSTSGTNTYRVGIMATDGQRGLSYTHTVTVDPIDEFPPEVVSSRSVDVPENSTAVQTLLVVDPDRPTNPFTYSIGMFGDDRDLFRITNGDQLEFITPPDYENPTSASGANTYRVGIVAQDVQQIVAYTVTVSVQPVNEHDPVFTSATTATLAEDTTRVVQTLTGTDADDFTFLEFSISGNGPDDLLFTTAGDELRFIGIPDFENPFDADGDNVYEVEVVVDDRQGRTATQIVSVSVTGINDNNPVFTSSATPAVDENTVAVQTLSATDADLPVQTISYSISGGADNAQFQLTAGNQLEFIVAPDFENPLDLDADNVYEVEVQADDAEGGITTQIVSVTVNPANEHAPVFTSASSVNIEENSPFVQFMAATDADLPAQMISFSIAGGADASLFQISSGARLEFLTAPDFENPTDSDADNVYQVKVQADDGNRGMTTQTVSVTVNPVNDNAPVFTSSASPSIDENATAVQTLSATDADLPAQTISFSIIGGLDAARFQITAGKQLEFIVAPDIENPVDSNTDNVYEVEVQADDGIGEITTQTVSVTVDPVNEFSPVFTSATDVMVRENDDEVLTLSATDADLPAQTISFSVAGTGADDALFEVVGEQLNFIEPPDFENPLDVVGDNVYHVDVQADDGDGGVTTQTVTVTVTDYHDNDFVVAATGPGSHPRVIVRDAVTDEVLFNFLAYDRTFRGGVNVASGDVNGDGVLDIITVPAEAGPPHVKIFSGVDGSMIDQLAAFGWGFRGGVRLASGDVNNDGLADVIVGAGPTGESRIKVFSGANKAVLRNYLLASSGFHGGVYVGSGDVDNDGFDDVVGGLGPGAAPRVKVHSGRTSGALANFLAFGSGFRGGVTVASGDVNGDGFDDVVTGVASMGRSRVKVFDGQNVSTVLSNFFAFSTSFLGGVTVGSADFGEDGSDDIIVGAGPGVGPRVKIFDGDGGLLSNRITFDSSFRGGVNVAGGRISQPESSAASAGSLLLSHATASEDSDFALAVILVEVADRTRGDRGSGASVDSESINESSEEELDAVFASLAEDQD